jgi:hypothetical protein
MPARLPDGVDAPSEGWLAALATVAGTRGARPWAPEGAKKPSAPQYVARPASAKSPYNTSPIVAPD